MTATTEAPPAGSTAALERKGRWIDHWDPEDPTFWNETGSPIARRNLLVSIFSEHVGFSIWSLWSVFVLFLGPKYGLSKVPADAAAQKFMLTTLPTALGAGVRIPYTLAVARFGGRNWTIVSALALLIPTVGAAIFLKEGSTYGELLVLSALAGVGGGNFASSMTNINAFYPQRLKGAALGLNAGGGNLGVAVVQLVGLLVLATAGKEHPRVILGVYIPLVVIAATCAALYMDNLSQVRNEKHALRDVCKDPNTWVMSVLYIGTFGSFIGFGFAFGQVLSNQFPAHFLSMNATTHKLAVDPVKVAYLTFLGPLIGSLIRPVGGWLADRVGGARTTMVNFLAMAAAALVVLIASIEKSLPVFFVGFILLFVFSGIGNGSTYKMIPAIFKAKSDVLVADGVTAAKASHDARRLSNALIGVAGAIGAFGGVFVNIAFRQSFLNYHNGNAAYVAFIVYYLICAALTVGVYVAPRRGRLAGV
ncbi:NNP family nitrate/nitrite transporter-like MFS transporter [Jatrophihabitans sp. GAS493]|uniref:nitrate/nitrite transporter n=1 Tax=Jatrophihabitans sp. GAS493 TaxID=1907575 RepID=UPI000BB848FA|nr:nitrate/nitrite transporter [Jatrophihabitans sp. GAS493]SOD70984.1 NNP family nitrate/nitrite transporter-like MFS transporter [Jatrophihabitans sp. GAS493]